MAIFDKNLGWAHPFFVLHQIPERSEGSGGAPLMFSLLL